MARWAVIAGLILALLGWVTWVYVGKALRIGALVREIRELRREELELFGHIAELEHLLERARDPEYMELWVRRVILYGYPGEVLVVFEGD